jgi:ribosome biogenesis ATPase
LDGLDSRNGVYVIAATNRPDMIDPAMCRPGRLDKLLYVDLPNASERIDIFKSLSRKLPLQETKDREAIYNMVGDATYEGFSGADLAALVREAGVIALRRSITNWDRASEQEHEEKVYVLREDFVLASKKVGPSVSVAQRRKYESLRTKFSGAIPTVKATEDGSIA